MTHTEWKAAFEKFLAEIPEEMRDTKRLSWTSRTTFIVSAYYGIGMAAQTLEQIGNRCYVSNERIRQLLNGARKMYMSYHSPKQTRVREAAVKHNASLRERFLKYFRNVPRNEWFAGRKDAPSPDQQLHAVQKVLNIDCAPFGGGPIPEERQTNAVEKHCLRVAESRLEQRERLQFVLRNRKRLCNMYFRP